MASSREGRDILFHLSGFWPNGAWRGWDMLRWHFWKSPYVWHDTVMQRVNRWIKCPLLGHQALKDISEAGEPSLIYCFDCATYPESK